MVMPQNGAVFRYECFDTREMFLIHILSYQKPQLYTNLASGVNFLLLIDKVLGKKLKLVNFYLNWSSAEIRIKYIHALICS